MTGHIVSEATQKNSAIQEIESATEHLVKVLSLFGFEPTLVKETTQHIRDALNRLEERSNG